MAVPPGSIVGSWFIGESAFCRCRLLRLERLESLGKRLFVGLLQLVVPPRDGRRAAELLEILLRFSAPFLLRDLVADVGARLLERFYLRLGPRLEGQKLVSPLRADCFRDFANL